MAALAGVVFAVTSVLTAGQLSKLVGAFRY